MTSVAICIPTYRRPIFLHCLLRSIAGLHTEGLTTWLVVVDNDAAGSARTTVAALEAELPRLVYEIEPERGLSVVRNRLVSIANRLGVDYVAFIDDDEWAEPSWLVNLVSTAQAHGAQATAGPVLHVFDDEVPDWLREDDVFHRPRFRTGHPLRLIAGANLLVEREWLGKFEGPFDRRFDLTGGEDTHMLDRLYRLGARMVWCDEAVVYERVTASRGNVRWILERRFRIGITNVKRDRLLNPGFRRRAQLRRSFARLSAQLAKLPIALRYPSRRNTLRILCRCAMEVGAVLGALGLSHEPYRHIHGR